MSGWIRGAVEGYLGRKWPALCDNVILSRETFGKETLGSAPSSSLSSPIARHAQEERPLRSCHDSSNSPGGMRGWGLLAHAPVGYIATARRRIVAGASAVLSAAFTGSC